MRHIKVLVRPHQVDFIEVKNWKVRPDAISLSTLGEKTSFYFRKDPSTENKHWRDQASTALMQSRYSMYVERWLPTHYVSKRRDRHKEAKQRMTRMF